MRLVVPVMGLTAFIVPPVSTPPVSYPIHPLLVLLGEFKAREPDYIQ
jgi:hypothetical protein